MEKMSKGKIVEFEKKLPHIVSELMCWHCGKRWISVRPQYTVLADCECPGCGQVGGIINTGQDYKELDK